MSILVCARLGIRRTDSAMVEQVDAALNAAHALAASKVETPFRFADAEIDVDENTEAIDRPADCRRVISVCLKSTGRPLSPGRRDVDALNYGNVAGDARSRGTPHSWEEIGEHLYVFPYPDAEDVLLVEYLKTITPMTLDTDEPIIAAECHYGLVEDAIEQMASAPPYDPRIAALAGRRRLEWDMLISYVHRGRSQRMAQIAEVFNQRQAGGRATWVRTNL